MREWLKPTIEETESGMEVTLAELSAGCGARRKLGLTLASVLSKFPFRFS